MKIKDVIIETTSIAELRKNIQVPKQRVSRQGIDLVVSIDDASADIRAMAGDRQLAYVIFDRDGNTLIADDLAVAERYQGQGIAKVMYDYVKELGFTVKRSPDQTDAGAAFWDKTKGAENNIWEQGVAEASYPGNIGMMEVAAFFNIASTKEKTIFKQLLNMGERTKAWQLIQKVTGVRLQGKEFVTSKSL